MEYHKIESNYWPFYITSKMPFTAHQVNEYEKWCIKNIGPRYTGFNKFAWTVGPNGVYFRNEEPSMQFMMTYGYEV